MGNILTKKIHGIVFTFEDRTKITGKVFSVPVNQLVAILPVAGNAFFTAIPRQIIGRLKLLYVSVQFPTAQFN